MLALFTDFGTGDPYAGQLHAVLARLAPAVPRIDLLHQVPAFDVRAGAYLLPAVASQFPTPTVFLCVVDPGVGGSRAPMMVKADKHWYVGPDNGLFALVARRAAACVCHVIRWRPAELSMSFHGRDLFAPCAARLALGEMPEAEAGVLSVPNGDWPDDWPQVIYIDHYGNAMTGLRAQVMPEGQRLRVGTKVLSHAPVFAQAPPGAAFWYVNSLGLVEIACNQASAAHQLGLRLGDRVAIAN